jgi:uncharacterized surface protein with fasciclin (FAS1) repeats
MKSIIGTVLDDGRFASLLDALKFARLTDMLRTPGPYTLFAPTDAAFAALPPGVLRALMRDLRRMQGVLTRHVVSGTLPVAAIAAGSIRNVEGSSLVAARSSGALTVHGAGIIAADVAASNGMIHVVDRVFLQRHADDAVAA